MPVRVLIRSLEIRKTRRGDNYGAMRVNLGAPGGFAEIDARIWDLDRLCGELGTPAPGDVVELTHREEEYNGKAQWVVSEWRLLSAAEREEALAQFRPARQIDLPFYERRLEELIGRVPAERAVGMVLRMIFDRAGFREAFAAAPAARDHHQNYPGGLLEHTIHVTTLALTLADAYAEPGRAGLTFNSRLLPIDRGVLTAAGLLHDIGKLQTYCFDPLPEITETQRWEGHLVLSYAQTREAAAPLLADPPHAGAADEINKLLHCLLAHHGQLEYGSPCVPACAEAFLLSQADMTDARLAEIATAGSAALERDPAVRWLPRSFHFAGGIFIGDWPRHE